MKFYRRLTPFKAISFDLDDTLYSNYPIMMAADKKMAAYFTRVFSTNNANVQHASQDFDFNFWLPFKKQALADNPALKHDVAQMRMQSYYLGMVAMGLSDSLARIQAKNALEEFEVHRSDFTVPESIHQLLSALAKKWPLVAITNGNVNTHAIGINQYFTAVYHADVNNKQKPCSDMFIKACDELNILPSELLHVGDCGRSDILGGIIAGCQTAWVSSYNIGKPLSILPHFELSDVADLQRLL